MESITSYPVLILCGSDPDRREILRVLDPDQNYPSKSLLPMQGRRVLDWQLDAMRNSKSVCDIFLIGLSEDEFPYPQQIHYIPSSTTTTILEKIIVGSEVLQTKYPKLDHLIISTGDVPGMTTESVDCFFEALEQNIDSDVLISGVPEDLTSQYFPNHNRIVGKFSDCQIYPGEMMALRHTIIQTLMEEIDQLSRRRRQFDRRTDTSKLLPLLRYLSKKPKLWLMILRYLSGNISIKEIEKKLSQVYQMNFHCVIVPDPGFGMDLDLPEDYQKLSDYLSISKLQDV